ncbi:rhomboid family intramembrane serine protease [Sphingobacterium rhinopitheci]|uniref:rhomboid family intramembrane serine protease n=1 Tax=Sphingobacterium rhinopitheci TaxID=2781960 RepID=UPI001F5296A4|nr:rhomboid family intramembrane serine protease [Sphingobacterium rhinopitheci]MCI0920350.1 rhomboid family intramembrane serine protease [Sphingobacterium rhinopitheci]
MKNSTFNTFVQKTYKSSSAITIIIAITVLLFIITNFLRLVQTEGTFISDLQLLTSLSLPPLFSSLISQPWSIVSHPFIYTDFFPLLFDCLWLYWIGNMFLNLLQPKYFLVAFFGGILVGAISFLLLNSIPFFGINSIEWTSISFGIAALLGSLLILSPKAELRLMIFGNVSLKTIAFVYLGIEIILFISKNQYATALSFAIATCYGLLFIRSMHNGKDWTTIFKKNKKRHLKVVYGSNKNYNIPKNEQPDQELIDQILDKISEKGYENLTKHEKEILFKASKKN